MSDDITQWWGIIVTLTNKFFQGLGLIKAYK
jgi:hypothetical protein